MRIMFLLISFLVLSACGGTPETNGDAPAQDTRVTADTSATDTATPIDSGLPSDTALPEDTTPATDTLEPPIDTNLPQDTLGPDDTQPPSDTTPPADTQADTDAYTTPPCEPVCEQKMCGDDGCGGTCGSCEEGTVCDDLGTCVTPSLEDQINGLIVGKYGFPDMTLLFDPAVITAQADAYPGSVSFIQALELAMESFLYDDSDEESPMAMAAFVAEVTWDPNNPMGQTFKEATFAVLLDYLNRPSATLNLVAFPKTAENGETVDKSWIFFLTIDEMSDHLYWAIVNRQGIQATYNYGFN